MARHQTSTSEADRTAVSGRAGLCARCRHLEVLRSKRSLFVRCRRADLDEAYPRYPVLPRLVCPGYENIDASGI